MIDIIQWRCSIGTFSNVGFSVGANVKRKNGTNVILSIFLLLMVFGAQIGHNFPQTISNKQSHIKYGNISGKGSYNILHINKGNSNFENKLDDLYILLEIHKPDIVSIQEAN